MTASTLRTPARTDDADASVPTLRARWLGRVSFAEAYDLQRALWRSVVGDAAADDYLLLLEHTPTYTQGSGADDANLRRARDDYATLGAELVRTDRGGDVTFHGPGQLVAYPVLRLPSSVGVVDHVRRLEEIVIRVLARWGITGLRDPGFTGVWVGTDAAPDVPAAKIAAIGCRVSRGVSMHGAAVNVTTDLDWFDHIVPCGIDDRTVTSMRELLGDDCPSMTDVVAAFVDESAAVFGRDTEFCGESFRDPVPRTPVKVLPLRAKAVAEGPSVREQARERPDWLRTRARLSDPGYRELKAMLRDLDLHTVCEEAGCPNIYECWSDRTATLMLLGDTCTRSCGFCEVNTGKPPVHDLEEPGRVAVAVDAMGLEHAVLTSVARDDLADGGAGIFAESIRRIRELRPTCRVEVLVPDFKGDAASAEVVFDARPDVFNHNLETVARLQRLTRPQAGYARSLTLLARAKQAGLVTKSGIICGMGETEDELIEAMADLAAVGVDILTLGQYLRPSAHHLPVARWVHPDEFARLRDAGLAMGFAHVESGPLVRSSYHAKVGAESATGDAT